MCMLNCNDVFASGLVYLETCACHTHLFHTHSCVYRVLLSGFYNLTSSLSKISLSLKNFIFLVLSSSSSSRLSSSQTCFIWLIRESITFFYIWSLILVLDQNSLIILVLDQILISRLISFDVICMCDLITPLSMHVWFDHAIVVLFSVLFGIVPLGFNHDLDQISLIEIYSLAHTYN